MCTSTVAVADALPAQPETVIGDSTVERSGICTSVPLVAAQPSGSATVTARAVGVGLGVGLARDGVGSVTASAASASASGQERP